LQLGIEPGSQVEFIAVGDHAIVRKIANTKEWTERFMKYKGSAKTSMSTEEILNLTRREW
jgi:bifunctional DNA-binding transcriptional regulator/antitoxin component of YhaV-PrlF toxin-antitoxin module